jgi:translocation and assembly module TamA
MRCAWATLVCLATAGCAGEAAQGRPWVHALGFRGVRHVDQDDLRQKISIDATSWVPLSPKRYLDPFAVETDRARIEAYYRAHGYFGARVTDAQVKPRDRDSVDVHFSVEEGPPTHIHSVALTGLEQLASAERAVQKIMRLRPGQVFSHDRYLEQKDLILGRLKALGYAWAEVDGKVEIERDAHTAEVRLSVTPGPRARFGGVEVRGTVAVDGRLVAARAGIDRGQPFSLESIEAARGRVYNLGIFSSVRIEYLHAPDHAEVAEVVITVREAQFHELRLGGGFGLESQRTDVHLSAIYTKRNFLGGLRSLKLRLEPAYVAIPAYWSLDKPGARQGIAGVAEAQFTQPDLFWRTELKWTVGYDLGIEYAYQYHGPRAQLGLDHHFWNERVHTALLYTFQLLNFFDTDPAILQSPSLAGRLFGFTDPYRLGWLGEEVALDLRDRPLDATRGGYLALNVEEGGEYAGGAFEYQKILPDVRGYLPLGSHVVLAARVEFGQLFVQGSLGSPITRRFYLGGPSSHRGFNYNRLSLQVQAKNPDGTPSSAPAIPIGGDQMFLGQLELRVDLFRLAGNWLAAAAFVDAGDVAAPACAQSCMLPQAASTHVDFTRLHWATGGGLRYHTVIGTLRADVGVRLNRLAPTEPDGLPNPDPGQRLAFHISVGEAF